MHRPPALEADTDGADLARLWPVGIDPHAGVLGEPTGRHAERGQRVDHQLLDVAHVLGGPHPVRHVDDRIADELPRPVIRDVTAAADADQLGTDVSGVAAQVAVEVRPWAVREDVRMLEQQQVLLASTVEQRLLDGQRLPVRDRAEPADAQHQTSDGPVPRLQDLLDPLEEVGGVGAVERSVVPRHGEVADRMDGDRLAAVGAGHHDGLAVDRVRRQDRHLRLVDDRHRQHRSRRAVVRDGERPATDLVGSELLRLRPTRQVVDLTSDRAQPLAVGIADHGHDEALIFEIDGDAEVDVVVHDDLVLADAGVEVWELGQRVDRRPADERQVGQAEALVLLPLPLHGAAGAVDVGEVHLDDAERVRADRLAHDHVGAGQLADLREPDAAVALAGGDRRCWRRSRCGRGGRSLGSLGSRSGLGRRFLRGRRGRRLAGGLGALGIDVVEHVVASDAAARTRAGDLRRVEAVLVDEATHDR